MKSFAMFRLNCELEELGRQTEFLNAATKRFAASAARMRPWWWHRLRDGLNRIFDRNRG